MEELHFARGDMARRVPADHAYLDRLIHASFVGEMRTERVTPEVKEAARSDLEEVLGFEGTSLDDFVPRGSPFFANAGHNGYTWEGSRRNYALEADVDGEVLMSPAFIGSSSDVYVPMLQVGRREGRITDTPDAIPKLMVYDGENFVEARYDTRTAKFVATENGQAVNPKTLRLLNSPQQKSDYVRDREKMEVPEHFKIEGQYVGGEFFVPSSFTNALKHVGRAIAFFGMDLHRFHDQLRYHFSPRGGMLRKMTDGDKWNGWISEEQIGSFSHASYEEVADAVKALKRNDFFDGKLNRFLLYKAFEQNEGSFLVGKIEGDGHTIHLPYIPVEVRKE